MHPDSLICTLTGQIFFNPIVLSCNDKHIIEEECINKINNHCPFCRVQLEHQNCKISNEMIANVKEYLDNNKEAYKDIYFSIDILEIEINKKVNYRLDWLLKHLDTAYLSADITFRACQLLTHIPLNNRLYNNLKDKFQFWQHLMSGIKTLNDEIAPGISAFAALAKTPEGCTLLSKEYDKKLKRQKSLFKKSLKYKTIITDKNDPLYGLPDIFRLLQFPEGYRLFEALLYAKTYQLENDIQHFKWLFSDEDRHNLLSGFYFDKLLPIPDNVVNDIEILEMLTKTNAACDILIRLSEIKNIIPAKNLLLLIKNGPYIGLPIFLKFLELGKTDFLFTHYDEDLVSLLTTPFESLPYGNRTLLHCLLMDYEPDEEDFLVRLFTRQLISFKDISHILLQSCNTLSFPDIPLCLLLIHTEKRRKLLFEFITYINHECFLKENFNPLKLEYFKWILQQEYGWEFICHLYEAGLYKVSDENTEYLKASVFEDGIYSLPLIIHLIYTVVSRQGDFNSVQGIIKAHRIFIDLDYKIATISLFEVLVNNMQFSFLSFLYFNGLAKFSDSNLLYLHSINSSTSLPLYFIFTEEEVNNSLNNRENDCSLLLDLFKNKKLFLPFDQNSDNNAIFKTIFELSYPFRLLIHLYHENLWKISTAQINFLINTPREKNLYFINQNSQVVFENCPPYLICIHDQFYQKFIIALCKNENLCLNLDEKIRANNNELTIFEFLYNHYKEFLYSLYQNNSCFVSEKFLFPLPLAGESARPVKYPKYLLIADDITGREFLTKYVIDNEIILDEETLSFPGYKFLCLFDHFVNDPDSHILLLKMYKANCIYLSSEFLYQNSLVISYIPYSVFPLSVGYPFDSFKNYLSLLLTTPAGYEFVYEMRNNPKPYNPKKEQEKFVRYSETFSLLSFICENKRKRDSTYDLEIQESDQLHKKKV